MFESPLRAVIDLGTNTFHLLIVAFLPEGTIDEYYRERIFVKLASDGIDRIGEEPFARGLKAMNHFRKIMDEYLVPRIYVIGTAALRRAKNGAEFIEAVREQTDIDIQLLSGDEEARLITKGVLAALPPLTERLLIMDIGGGSTEYIIVEGNRVLWQQSFPIGLSILHQRFHRSDPISTLEQTELNDFLTEVTQPLLEALQRFPTHHLAGAAGTFDVLVDMLADEQAADSHTSKALDFTGFPAIRDSIVSASVNERALIPGLPPQRVDMVVVALLLLDFTLRLADISRVTVSQYALKEGVLIEQAIASGDHPG